MYRLYIVFSREIKDSVLWSRNQLPVNWINNRVKGQIHSIPLSLFSHNVWSRFYSFHTLKAVDLVVNEIYAKISFIVVKF